MTRDESAGVLIARVIAREGGIADVGDGKGVTAFGQTSAWLATFGLPEPASPEAAAANYSTWLVRTRLIGVCDQPDSFADVTIDFAVHSGHQVAIRALQKALGVGVDGVYGPETQAAVDTVDRARAARHVIGGRLRFVGRLITDAPGSHARYAAGWCARLAGQIEALS